MMQEMMMTKKTMMLDAGDVALSLTRRQLFGGAGALALAAALPGAALAQGQAEWRQSYDAGSVRSLKTRSNYPMLGPDSVIATEQAIQQYRQLAAQGGWQPLRINERLRLGARGPEVVALRQRLAITGDIDPAAGGSATFDSYVEAGVRHFQNRHGLTPTGAINRGTLNALNAPIELRIRQLETNLVRLRSYWAISGRAMLSPTSRRRWLRRSRAGRLRRATPPVSARSTGSRPFSRRAFRK